MRYDSLLEKFKPLKEEVDRLHGEAVGNIEKADLQAIGHYLKKCIESAEELVTLGK